MSIKYRVCGLFGMLLIVIVDYRQKLCHLFGNYIFIPLSDWVYSNEWIWI